MGNSFTALCINKKEDKTIQLVHPNGSVQILGKPLIAGQIVQEFPQNLVCHSDSFYIRKKTHGLSPNEKLKPGNKYFVMPEEFFECELSLQSLASFISRPTQKGQSGLSGAACLRRIERASVLCNPFVIEKDVSGSQRIRVSAEFITKLMEDGRLKDDGRGHAVENASADKENRLCNTPELQKAYENLVASRGQRWRPKLDTIIEKDVVDRHKMINKIKYIRVKRH